MSYILVVDDEKDIRDLISQILFEEGHTVKLAHNSTSAIDYINNLIHYGNKKGLILHMRL